MSLWNREKATLLLEDGSSFEGFSYGASGTTTGEVVFNTAMTGYQEILTDPSYRSQMITMTYPHIGNYGVNAVDMESDTIQVSGFIVRAPSLGDSNWQSDGGLEEWLVRDGIVGISGIDTRALVRRIREKGAMSGCIMTGEHSLDELKARLEEEPPMLGRDLVSEVTCGASYEWTEPLYRLKGEVEIRPEPAKPEQPYKVVAYDFGIKRNILRLLVEHGCEVTVVPASTKAEEVLNMNPEGIFLSNGPGDPSAVHYAIENVKQLMGTRPMFGICLGHQIAALAMGASTYKMRFGHRGANQPVLDSVSGRVEITSQNHGFAVSEKGLPDGVSVNYLNLNDRTVEGLDYPAKAFFSVQHHPEASPGPHDADHLFHRFVRLMERRREGS